MNEERLQEIRDSRNTLASHPTGRMLVSRYVRHIDALLAEIERLQADVAYWRDETAKVNEHRAAVIIERDHFRRRYNAMREIVQAVATMKSPYGTWPCPWCGESAEYALDIAHTPDCFVTKARAIQEESE